MKRKDVKHDRRVAHQERRDHRQAEITGMTADDIRNARRDRRRETRTSQPRKNT